MSDNLTCNVCGGTDFMKEAGFYYCNECQTQTQELREQEYEMEETLGNVRLKSKKIPQSKASSESNVKITSWEGYNYILAGLVKELINLGANSELKEVTYQLWMAYLMKLEIISNKANIIPKLGATYKKKDAEIVYQHKHKKRIRKYAPSTSYDASDSDLRSYYKEKAKNKRALVRAEYETFTTNTQSSDNQSLLNKTLSNIGSSDDDSDHLEKCIQYNKVAKKELLKHMSRSHFKMHAKDVEGNLPCHKYKSQLTSSYFKSPFILTRNKLYSVLYIGLLLTEDDIQLSDILRFCREGHLSFLSYNHLFPEHFSEKQIDQILYQDGIKTVPSHENIRETVYGIQKLLRFKAYNFCPDLNKLCERYCMEMNLPDEIKIMVINLIDETKPKFKYTYNALPNYEGRIMAFILYILKLFFGLDGVTEFKFSTFAEEINKTQQFCGMNKMFVFSDWIKYIEYRKLILKKQHFPSSYLLNHKSISSSNLFVSFLQTQSSEEDIRDKQNLKMDIVQKLLNDLKILQNSSYTKYLDFPSTLTPMQTYTQIILEERNLLIHGQEIKKDVLQTLTNTKLDFLVHFKKYLKKLNDKNYTVVDKSANNNCHFTKSVNDEEIEINNFEVYEKEWMEAFEKIKIDELSLDKLENKLMKKELSDKSNENLTYDLPVNHKDINKDLIINMNNKNNKHRVGRNRKGRFCSVKSSEKVDPFDYPTPRKRGKWFISSWTENPLLDQNHFNPLYAVTKGKSLESIVESKLTNKKQRKRKLDDLENVSKCNCHFQPNMEYWINVADMKTINRFKWKKLETSLPTTFQWLLNECARTIEQTPKDLYTEFVTVELYVTYVYLKKSPTHTSSGIDNSLKLTKLISKISKEW